MKITTSHRSPVDNSLEFPCGKMMKNRFMLAPLTNTQSHEDGTLSEAELHWLTMRAQGGFGMVMTCATLVKFNGKCWQGQLGIYEDTQMEGHQRLARAIKDEGSLAVVQLHHGGMRSDGGLTGEQPVCPSDNAEHQARAMRLEEVWDVRDQFIAAAQRAKACGYDGVEVHGAHGYLLCQFLSAVINTREDAYGGSLENRARLLFEIVNGIREACGPEFLLGVRLSPERFGMDLREVVEVCKWLIKEGNTDFLDVSLWDVFKYPADTAREEKLLRDYFTEIDRGGVKLTVAGKIYGASEVQSVLDSGVDFVTIGRSAILHHDFPEQVMQNPEFRPVSLPVSKAWLRKEGVGERFLTYLGKWSGFIGSEDQG
ncbi:NADH:flavin oxidoreductase [Robertkochia flava]|uniref:NADH:flavin oxidoreductase n=1 Tax=Robertkochia flava TaxID=3447986 RepID=UPI001CCA273A|nr:NADH:flavin oxidoreductase [Robertkochia marina]